MHPNSKKFGSILPKVGAASAYIKNPGTSRLYIFKSSI